MAYRRVVSRFGAVMWLLSGAWLLVIRFGFWTAGYAQWGELGGALLLLGGLVFLALAGLFWLRFGRALQAGWIIGVVMLGAWITGRTLSGRFLWLDYGLMALLALTTFVSLRTRASTRQRKKLSPLDYPVFG